MTLLAQCLMSTHGALGSIPAVHKLVMVAYTLSAQEMEAEGWDIQGHPGLYFEANLGYLRLSEKKGGREGAFFRTSVVCYKKNFLDYVFPDLIFFPKGGKILTHHTDSNPFEDCGKFQTDSFSDKTLSVNTHVPIVHPPGITHGHHGHLLLFTFYFEANVKLHTSHFVHSSAPVILGPLRTHGQNILSCPKLIKSHNIIKYPAQWVVFSCCFFFVLFLSQSLSV